MTGSELKQLLDETNLSYSDAAGLTGYTSQYIGMMVRGEAPITAVALEKIKEAIARYSAQVANANARLAEARPA